MLRSVNRMLRNSRQRYRRPQRVQDMIPVRRIYPDGIFLSGRRYSMTWKFSDINYSSEGEQKREELFFRYRDLLNCLDTEAETKITVRNRKADPQELRDSVYLRYRQDGLDRYREEYNEKVLSGSLDTGGSVQDKFITVSVYKSGIEEARSYFRRAEQELRPAFSAMGSSLTAMDAAEKLRLLHDFYRSGEKIPICPEDMARRGEDFRNMICPDSAEITPSFIRLDERYVRVLYLKHYANAIEDDFLKALTDISPGMTVSVDILPVPADEAIREVENRLLGIETNITRWQRRQNRNNNFSAGVPYDLQLQRQETRQFLDDLASRDQRMMLALITVMISADSEKELDVFTEAVRSFAASRMCQLAVLRYQQLEGLNTVLPVGTRKIDAFRTLVSESLAVFIPFRVQEIADKGGTFIGTNAVSGNMILCSREKLMNQSAFLLGVPGSGKSFLAKQMILSLLLNTEDDILICDPEGEYVPIAKAAEKHGKVIRISAQDGDRLNPMYLNTDERGREELVMKSELILSLIERIENRPLGPKHRSVIDRCIRRVYRDCAEMGTVPTLMHLRDELLKQKEPEAGEIALSLELYTTGSLSIFSGQADTDTSGRLVVFDIHELEENLKAAGLLIITDTMLTRVNENWRKGKRTHLFIDEFHVVFSNEHSAEFFSSAWRQFRKRNAYPTAITQNVDQVLDSIKARTMLANSEFVIILSQSPSDSKRLAEMFRISDDQLRYINSTRPGCGLIRYAGTLVPFENRFPKDTSLYDLMTTTPGEAWSRDNYHRRFRGNRPRGGDRDPADTGR